MTNGRPVQMMVRLVAVVGWRISSIIAINATILFDAFFLICCLHSSNNGHRLSRKAEQIDKSLLIITN